MSRPVIVGLIGGITVLISGLLISILPTIINNKVKKELVLLPGNDVFDKWTNVDIPIYMSFRLFDVQNPEEIEFNGSKPIVVERGPYTFLQKRWKEIVSFDETDKFVEYKEFKSYHFLRDRSVGDLSDEVTAVNIPLVAAIDGSLRESETSHLGLVIVDVINAVIKELEEPLFEVHTLDEMLFSGYQVPLLERMGEIATGFGLDVPEGLPNNTFGLMVNKNNTDSGLFKVHTGLFGHPFKVHSWNNMTFLPYWRDSTCNQINGTDGGGFGPGIGRRRPLYVFQPDFCRSAHVVYQKDSSVFGIETYRFVIPDTLFQSATKFPANKCFCTQRKGHRQICGLDGLLDMSSCSEGAPIVMSQVHFLGASSKLREDVIGLQPDPSKHEMYLDIEPITGSVLNAARRMQINVRIKPSAEVPTVSMVPDVILPVLWLEETASIDAELAAEIKSALGLIPMLMLCLRLLLLFGLLSIVAAVAMNMMAGQSSKTTPAPQRT